MVYTFLLDSKRSQGIRQKVELKGSSKTAGDTTRTAIGRLGLKVGQAFGYWFDFGDDWWHQINVVDIRDKAGRKQYPKVTKREGESPPQYADLECEE